MAEPWEDPRSYAPAQKSHRGLVVGVRAALASSVLGIAVYGGMHPDFLGPDRDASGAIAAGGSVTPVDLHVGDCIEEFGDRQEISHVPAIACTKPHHAEVYAILVLARTEYPGDDELSSLADAKCSRAFDLLQDVSPELMADPTLGLSWLLPFEADWVGGDHRITCLVETRTARTDPIRQQTGA